MDTHTHTLPSCVQFRVNSLHVELPISQRQNLTGRAGLGKVLLQSLPPHHLRWISSQNTVVVRYPGPHSVGNSGGSTGGGDTGDRPSPKASKKIKRSPKKTERGEATCKRSFSALRRVRNYLRSDISGNVKAPIIGHGAMSDSLLCKESA